MHSWQGRPLQFTAAAYRELSKYGLSAEDVIEILDFGYEFPEKKRKEGIYERCLRKENVMTKVVVSDSYSYDLKEAIWLVIHIMSVKT